MRKRFLRLTTAMAVVAIGMGCGMPAWAQLGGLLGGVPGGDKKDAAPATDPKQLLDAAAKDILQARSVDERGRNLLMASSTAVNMANSILDGTAKVVSRTNDVVLKLKNAETDIRSRDGALSDQIAKSLNAKKEADEAIRKANTKAADQTTTSGAAINAANLVGGQEAIAAAVAPAKKDADAASAAMKKEAAKLSGAAADIKGAYANNVVLPVVGDLGYASGYLKGTTDNLGRITQQLDKIDQEAKREQAQLIKDGAQTAIALTKRVVELQAAIGSLSSNPLGAVDTINKIKGTITTINTFADAIKQNQSQIEVVNKELGEVNAIMKQIRPKIDSANFAASTVVAGVQSVVSVITK